MDVEHIVGLATEEEGEDGGKRATVFVLYIFLGCTMGVLSRFLINTLSIPLPYTVLLFTLGLPMGALLGMHTETKINVAPGIILMAFLPILIFESAFEMDLHTFRKTVFQVLWLAVPGVLIVAMLLSLVGLNIFTYGWNFATSMMLGSILSATDPVAVVAILSELDASTQMSVIIEGESLLNDGTGVVLYDVFETLSVEGLEVLKTPYGWWQNVIRVLLQKAIGGPIFGFLSGYLCVFWLQHIFNDAVAEITITLVGPYLVYTIGILALVVFGLVLNNNKTSISPEVETFLVRFWGLLAYLANTLIFILMGVQIGQQINLVLDLEDVFMGISLYFALNVTRGLMVLGLSPILARLGYGLQWQEAAVMIWGGLRGAVSMVLALHVTGIEELDLKRIRLKILLHVAMSVFFTLVINATTMVKLLNLLGMNDVSAAKRAAMTNALNYLLDLRGKSLNVLKNDRFLSDACWDAVEEICDLEDPYYKLNQADAVSSDIEIKATPICPTCNSELPSQPTAKELQDMTNEAILRVLRAEKMSYWRQFEQGLLSKEAVRKLTDFTDKAADLKGTFVSIESIQSVSQVPALLITMKHTLKQVYIRHPGPRSHEPWRLALHRFNTNQYLSIAWSMLVLLDFCTTVVCLASIARPVTNSNSYFGTQIINGMIVSMWVIKVTLWLVVTKMEYFLFCWMGVYFFLALLGLVDLAIHLSLNPRLEALPREHPMFWLLTVFVALRLMRLVGLIDTAIQLMYDQVKQAIAAHLSSAYDVGRGFVVGEEEVRKLIEHVIDNPDLAKQLQVHSDEIKLAVIRDIGILQKEYPEIALSVKTRQAIRTVLNHLRDGIRELTEDGILQAGESQKLLKSVEEQMKRILYSPPRVSLPSYEQMISHVPWLKDDPTLIAFIKERAMVERMNFGDVLFFQGDHCEDIYIIASGLCRIEASSRVVDFLGSGVVIGEMSFLTKQPRTATVICETAVTLLKITKEKMQEAVEQFAGSSPPLEDRLWLVCAARLGANVLMDQPHYKGVPVDRVRMDIQNSYIFKCPKCEVFQMDNTMSDVILVAGSAKNFYSDQMYKAPCYIPWNLLKLRLIREEGLSVVFLVVRAPGFKAEEMQELQGYCKEHHPPLSASRIKLNEMAKGKQASTYGEGTSRAMNPSEDARKPFIVLDNENKSSNRTDRSNNACLEYLNPVPAVSSHTAFLVPLTSPPSACSHTHIEELPLHPDPSLASARQRRSRRGRGSGDHSSRDRETPSPPFKAWM